MEFLNDSDDEFHDMVSDSSGPHDHSVDVSHLFLSCEVALTPWIDTAPSGASWVVPGTDETKLASPTQSTKGLQDAFEAFLLSY